MCQSLLVRMHKETESMKWVASEFNQPITYFYSNDSFGREDDPDNLDTRVH